jgi:hypothetical protein
MKKNTLLALLGATLVGTVIGWAAAAATYQKTGVVKEVGSDTFTLDLGKEEWRFYTDGSTQGKEAVKAGQKVTVTYKQLATKVEAKK